MTDEFRITLPEGVDVRKLVKEAYALSKPQGLGLLHAKDGDLDDETVDQILSRETSNILFSMDYVHGRAVKFRVFKRDGKLRINKHWYDHSEAQLEELLRRCSPETAKG